MASEQEVSSNEEKTETSTASEEVKNDKPMNGTTDDDEKKESETEKSEENEEPTPELLKKIKNQIEFYFGDVNMQRDKFLIEQVKLDNGWVPMTVMLNFKLLASLSKDINVILKAVESSDLIEISEDKKSIRRSPKYPLPVYNEEYRKAQEGRTVYLKGFSQTETTIKTLKDFFDQFEPYENIIMRKYLDKNKKLRFKGSVFVQFKTLEDAEAFMARESVKYQNEELIRKWSKDYTVEHQKEIAERREAKKNKKVKKQNQEEKKVDGTTETDDTNEKTEESTVVGELPKGTVIHFQVLSGSITKFILREQFEQYGIAYIEFHNNEREGYIRFRKENTAKKVYETLTDGNLTVENSVVTCRVLADEEEDDFLQKARTYMTANSKRTYRNYRAAKKAERKRRATSPIPETTPAKVSAVVE